MSGRIGEPANPYEEEGIPATDDWIAGKEIAGDTQNFMMVPGDEPEAVDQWGTTALEEVLGEPHDVRISHEEPDVLAAVDADANEAPGAADPYPNDPDERVGRIVDVDGGIGEDTEADMVGNDVGTDFGGFSAEERAMHIEYDTGR